MKLHQYPLYSLQRAIGLLLLLLLFFVSIKGFGQSATVATPLGIGRDGCGGGTEGVRELSYNSATNSLGNTTPLCIPSLGGPAYSSFLSSVAFNPADHLFYYIQVQWTGSNWNSYVFRWDPYTCPGPNLPVYQTYTNQFIAGIAFDKNGIGWQINFTGGAPYGLELQRVDFSAGTIGAPQPIILPAGVTIMQQAGDVEMTPSSQFYAVFDNYMLTINYQDYGINPLNATFINVLAAPPGHVLVALAYSDGKFVGHLNGPTCIYQEINNLTGATSPVVYGDVFSATDFTNIASSIGSSKALISSSPTGTPGVYDLVYDVLVKNFGNVPDSNIQVTDDLAAVYGAGNISNVSLSWVGSAPAGFTLNGGYNGIGTNDLLIAASTNVLNNFPVSGNNFTIRISLRVAGIVPGIVYNNNAAVTATGYHAVALRDSSTNGSNPDLNSNDKPDDIGEAQPTPFVINVAAEAPPCSALNTVIYNQDFGTGTGLTTTLPGTVKTEYTGSTTDPLDIEQYALSENANNGNSTRWINLSDNTGNANGRMLLVNADVLGSKIFIDTVDVECGNLKYSFFGYAAFTGNATYQTFCNAFGGFKYPKLIFAVRNAADNSIITNITTSDITSNSWTQYGMKWVMPAGVTRVILEIYNAGEGGCGNDLALDDIQFGLCDPQPSIAVIPPIGGCLGGTTTINASLSDTTGMSATLVYQWQSSTDNTVWADISGATNASLIISPLTLADSKYYRLIVASTGNITNPSCNYISNSLFLTLKYESTAPVSAIKNKNNTCPGDAVLLTVTGGTLGDNAVWRWYSASCGGTVEGTGTSISVNPAVTTTYYVRAEGDCNSTTCVSVTVTINCDIDDDDDGITDLAESGGVDPMNDTDSDGTADYLDSDYAGFADSNSDGVNDNFDTDLDGIINSLDLDSDNDGIADVVEAYGVDANGDGRIDDYTDTDADGLSQNVDGNNTGHLSSGTGLGIPDLDGDGVPNYLDLDSDNDGIPDVLEAGGTDANNDGKIDGFTDNDADGFSDNVDGDADNNGSAENASNSLLRTGGDANSNGRADSYPYKNFDSDTRSNPYDVDSDGDGISDVREAGFNDADNNGFSDGTKGTDGWDDTIDAQGSLTISNSDGDVNLNYLDIDADNDGIPDNVEGIATNSYQFSLNTDTDDDGLDNRYDNIAGFGGNGITPNDQDADAVPDYIDTDTDNDGLIDIIEGNDFNLNRIPDDNVTLTGVDTDGDGLDDRFDVSNGSIEGTSQYMGTAGILVGDATPGSNTMVQKSYPAFPERDWRYAAYILEVSFLNFMGNRETDLVNLRWVVTCDKVIDHFDIERSADGVKFTKVGETKGIGTVCRATPFSYRENISGVTVNKIYYRIKVVTTSDSYKRSQFIVIAKPAVSEILVSPNPASHYVNITCNALGDELAEIDIIDASGKTVIRQQQRLYSGINTFGVQGIERLARGVYTLRIKTGLDIIRKKIIIRPE